MVSSKDFICLGADQSDPAAKRVSMYARRWLTVLSKGVVLR